MPEPNTPRRGGGSLAVRRLNPAAVRRLQIPLSEPTSVDPRRKDCVELGEQPRVAAAREGTDARASP